MLTQLAMGPADGCGPAAAEGSGDAAGVCAEVECKDGVPRDGPAQAELTEINATTASAIADTWSFRYIIG